MRKELLMGCGQRTQKDLFVNDRSEFEGVVRLDHNADHKPDIVWDLRKHPLPFADNEFDEIHVYDVLEHLAPQGDYQFFFNEFNEYWRILKPDGLFHASVPDLMSRWAWGDPSHTRVIMPENLTFLQQAEYEKQVGKTKMSDFRYLYKADFKVVHLNIKDGTFFFILQAVKP